MSKSKRAPKQAETKSTDQERRDEILIRAFDLVNTFYDFCNVHDGSTVSTSNNDCIADVLLSIDWTSNPEIAKRLLISIVHTLPVDSLDSFSDEIRSDGSFQRRQNHSFNFYRQYLRLSN